MKPNDLRIGNFVKLRDTGEIVRVCGLTSKKIRYHKGNDRSTNLSSRKYCEIEGVPIYDHWQNIETCELLHCGYEDGDEMYFYYLAKYPHRIIRYIHELQNIHYALTGDELKIEL